MRNYLIPSLLAAVMLASCSKMFAFSMEGLSPFEQHMATNRLHIARLIYKKDFVELCEFYAFFHSDTYLQDNGINVRGPAGGEYMHGRELLALCGPDCSTESGLGIVLEHFLFKRN